MNSPAASSGASPTLEHLHRTATELAAALDVREAVSAVLRTGRDVLRTNTCGVSLLEETSDVLVPQLPVEALAGLGFGRPVPLDSATPSAEAARTLRPVLLRDRAELAARFGAGPGGLNDSVLAQGEHSWAMYPLLARGRLVGVLRFGFTREGSLDVDQQVFAATLAGQCALAVERARLLRDARRSERRYRTLAEAGSLDVFTARPGEGITGDLPGWTALTGRQDVRGTGWHQDVHPDDLPGVLARIAEAVADRVAARTRFRIATPDGWRTIAAVAVPVLSDPTDPRSDVLEWVGSLDDVTDRARAARRTRTLQALTSALATATTYPKLLDAVLRVCLDGPGAVRATLALVEGQGDGAALTLHRMLTDRERRSADLPTITLEDLTAIAGQNGRYLVGVRGIAALPDLVRGNFEAAYAAGETAWAVLPLSTRRRQLGSLTLGFTEPGVDDEEEREFLLTFARQVSSALERMQLLQVQRDTATVLQEALRPGPLPHVEWLATHRSAATSAGVEVGGDWAEIIPLDEDRVAVVLGDVMGRGARAATVMGEVRTQVRTLAVIDPHPTAVLRGLDACARAGGGEDLVTIFYAVLARDGELLAASAGHLPPLTCSEGPHYLDVPPGVPIGVEGDARTDVLAVRLDPGSALVVFSDGLVETRARSLTEGLDEVLRHFHDEAYGTPEEIVEALVREMVGPDTAGSAVDDDVTVLGLRLR